tara:strand:+ start:951 stop:1619 length:669 start_codon:yes stop_codon:yes gene_type:complete
MSLQTIINNATYLTVRQQQLAGQSISRSGRILTATIASAQPYRFEIGMHDGLTYSSNRDLLQSIDNLDITVEETVNIGSTNTGLAYITDYRGGMTNAQIAQCTVTSASAGEVVLNTSAVTGDTPANAFAKGDFVQFASPYRYPYQVKEDVAWNASSVTIPINRNYIPQDSYTLAGKGIVAGTGCTWTVKMFRKPSFTIVPYDRIEFENKKFEIVEIIRKQDT